MKTATLSLILALFLNQEKSKCYAKGVLNMQKNGMNDLFILDEDDMIIPTISDKTNKPAS